MGCAAVLIQQTLSPAALEWFQFRDRERQSAPRGVSLKRIARLEILTERR